MEFIRQSDSKNQIERFTQRQEIAEAREDMTLAKCLQPSKRWGCLQNFFGQNAKRIKTRPGNSLGCEFNVVAIAAADFNTLHIRS